MVSGIKTICLAFENTFGITRRLVTHKTALTPRDALIYYTIKYMTKPLETRFYFTRVLVSVQPAERVLLY